jgi:uncharacterized protein
MIESALYVGHVVHSRRKPRQHKLRYRCFWLLLNIDDIPAVSKGLRLFSHNRANIISFRDRDHGARTDEALRPYVERQLAAAGIVQPAGQIMLLTMPRILGYAFNPISIYYCHDTDGLLLAMLYEVRNTFGERHSYLIPVADPASRVIMQSCTKALYVSPFMDMGLTYDFRVTRPNDALSVAVMAGDASGNILTAAVTALRRPLTDRALASLLVTHPLLTLKVIAAIHYEALLLVLKGIRLTARPAPPAEPVSIVSRTPQTTAHHG